MTTVTQVQSSKNALSADFLASVNPKVKSADSNMQITEDRFLKLLTTQLKNQDPTNPMDNAQMTSQMAQISTVTGIDKLNTTLSNLVSNSTDSQAMQAAAMLGREVLVEGSGLAVGTPGIPAVGGIELAEPADMVTVTVSDANGISIKTLKLGPQAAGVSDFAWDATNDAGAQVAAGNYRFAVAATRGADKLTATTLNLAGVTGIVREAKGISLALTGIDGSNTQTAMSKVRQIY